MRQKRIHPQAIATSSQMAARLENLRVVHSLIHCTSNKVMYRLSAFLASFALLVALWVAFYFTLAPSSA